MLTSKTFSRNKSTIPCKKFLKEIIIFINIVKRNVVLFQKKMIIKHFSAAQTLHNSRIYFLFWPKHSSIEKMRATTRTEYCKGKTKYIRGKIRRWQHGGFLNRYDFPYAGRDTVNQVMNGQHLLAPKLIGQASREIDKIAEARVKQLINKSIQQVQKIAPQIIRGAIEDVYKTPFRLLGNLSKKKLLNWKKTFKKGNKVNIALFETRITNKIYDGCATRYANGKRKLIDFEKCGRYLLPTSEPFWEQLSDTHRMQTRNSTKKRPLIVGLFNYV